MENLSDEINYPELLAGLLSRYVGVGQQISVEELAERVGMATKTLYLTRQGKYTPGFNLAMRIVRELPTEAADEFFAALGFFGLRRTEAPPACHREFHAVVAQTGAQYAEFFADGKIDHREALTLRHRILPRLSAMLARVRAQA